MEKVTKNEAQIALDTLEKYGETFYKPEYVDKIDKWAKVGMSIAGLSDNCKGFASMLYEALEWWNWHSENCVLNWVFRLGFTMTKRDVESVVRLVSRNNVTILGDWNGTGFPERHVNVKVVVEWLD